MKNSIIGSFGTFEAPRRAPAVFLAGALCASSFAAYPYSYPDCADANDTQFKKTDLVTRAMHQIEEPLKLAFDLVAAPGEDAAGKVDVYFVERFGKIRKYDSKTQTVMTLATMTPPTGGSDGLTGIALDPAFKANHRVYLFYTYSGVGEIAYRVSRFVLDAQHTKLDLASEKVLLRIPVGLGQVHTGGAMQFDAYGDLWIAVGDAGADIKGSPNTMSMRGKILRIHPNDDATYSIPKGNLFPAGTAKTLPEIYIMGNRNPYTLTIDPVRRWISWGDVGPDGYKNPDSSRGSTEEKNFATAPNNQGWPFFAGNNYPILAGIDPAKPVMPAINWGTTPRGLDTLPPATPSFFPYPQATSMTGPIYRYDGDLKSSVKWPPHFNRKWFTTEFGGRGPITVFTLSDDGKSRLAQDTVLKNLTLFNPLDFQAGPDGAMYVVNYAGYRTVTVNTGIVRIEYTGDCRPLTPKLETPTGLARVPSPGIPEKGIRVRGKSMSMTFSGPHGMDMRDLQGRALP
jgi:cytochrome c